MAAVEIIALSNEGKFCIFKNIVLSVNNFRGELCFLIFHFHFIISTGPLSLNKAGYRATLVACGWAGAVLEKVTRASGQEL